MKSNDYVLRITSPEVADKGQSAWAVVPSRQFKDGYAPETPMQIELPSNIDGIPLVRGMRIGLRMRAFAEGPQYLEPEQFKILSPEELANIPKHYGGDQEWA